MIRPTSDQTRSRFRVIAASLYALLGVSLAAALAAPNLNNVGDHFAQSLAAATTPPLATATRQITPRMAFQALQAQTTVPLKATWNSVTGIPDFIGTGSKTGRIPYKPSAAEKGKPLAIALGFLDANRALFKLRSAMDEFKLLRLEPDKQLNYSHVRMGQMYKGIPVFGRQMVVHLDAQEQIVAINGQYLPEIDIPTQAVLSKSAAEALALQELKEVALEPQEAASVKPQVFSDRTELTIFVDENGKPTLTWLVKMLTLNPRGQWDFFVNARRPVVTHYRDFSHNLKRRVTFTARNGTDIPGRKMIDEGERSNDPVAQAAHDHAGIVYDFYFNNFKRDSLDGNGLPLVSTVHYGSDPSEAENAAWVSEMQQMIYGDGGRLFKPLPYGLDVVGHEFTHGIINNTADLVYEGQAGALNESYADVFGVLISKSDWTVGKPVVKSPPYPTKYLRSLADPNAEGYYDPNQPLGGVGQPAHMNEYARLPISRRYDNGGVHINSGIPNHAAYQIAQVLGNDKVAQIYYRALTQYLTPESKFIDAYNATVQAARDLYGDAEVKAVQQGFAKVGIGDGTTSPEAPRSQQTPRGQTRPVDTAQIPAGCSNLVVNGSFESEDAWTQIVKGGTGLIDSEVVHSGSRAAWLGGQDQESPTIIVQDITIPANATKVTLQYWRLIHEELRGIFNFGAEEANFGIILVSPEGNVLSTVEKIASTSGDDTWAQKASDLSQLAGKKVRLLFAAENPRNNVSSMFVDDVAMIACTTGNTPTAPTTQTADDVYIKGTVLDGVTGRGVPGARIFILKPGISAQQAAADDNISASEVTTTATADNNGEFTTEAPVKRGQTYSAIVIARGFRPIIADDGIVIDRDSENPYVINATMRRSGFGLVASP